MKKYLLPILLIVLLFCLLGVSLAACNLLDDMLDDPDASDFMFVEMDIGGYGMKQYWGKDENVVIPPTYDGKPVTLIGQKAFMLSKALKITSIEIPASVIFIQDNAFYECKSLDTVYYKGTLSEWCNITFKGFMANPLCYAHHLYINGEEVTGALQIPEGVQTVKPYSFYAVERVDSLSMSKSVKNIGECAFAGNSYLQKVDIGEGVTFIGKRAFEGCNNLSEVTLGNNLELIGDRAFYDSNIKALDIPESVTGIGIDGFGGNSEMSTLTIRSKILHVYTTAFVGCKSLQYVNYIGDFKDWLNFEFDSYLSNPMYLSKTLYINGELLPNQPVIPDGTLNINRYTLINFENMTSIILPVSLVSMNTGAFQYCSNLQSIYFKGNEQQWKAVDFGRVNNPLPHITKYFYSEDDPYENGTAGKFDDYWHYDQEQQPQLWIRH